jgi:hypothetical protein
MNLSMIWSVLKWVLVVLAAGFIGQFGRVFAMRLIERRQKERAKDHKGKQLQTPPPEMHLVEKRLKAAVKLEKKHAKSEAKKAKKSSG